MEEVEGIDTNKIEDSPSQKVIEEETKGSPVSSHKVVVEEIKEPRPPAPAAAPAEGKAGDELEKSDDTKPEGEEGEESKEDDEDEDGEYEDDSDEIAEDAQALQDELNKIVVFPPAPPESDEVFDPDDYPPSYKDNMPKELLVLKYAENFRRQYAYLYRDRKPLFLNPVNECGVPKFVSTTLRPTQLQYRELYTWDGVAEFVADYLDFESLYPSYDLPTRLLSPATILKRQKGNCFEYTTLLCSLLIAVGYDAYVVSGYANRETCMADETREICPLLQRKEEEAEPPVEKEVRKYSIRPPKDLRSKFILKMEARREAEELAEEQRIKDEEEQKQLELEKPPPDPLHGLRIHAWVMVLSGKREIPETFFIEPFTGLSYPVESPNYLGIESVWNHVNYWVNMQDCSDGVGLISYDLGDPTKWEYMFPGLEKPVLEVPEVNSADDFGMDDEEEDKDKDVEKHLDMPPSWVEPLRLSQRDYEMRCPQGKKVKLYKRAKLEKFAHYLLKDGLTSRLSIYDNRELTPVGLVMVKEFYMHRGDKLHTRIHNHHSGWITEIFYEGRSHCLHEHQYKASSPGFESDRTMLFYDKARVDGLNKRVETPQEMIEHYIQRDDFLYFKQTSFGKRAKRFGPKETSDQALNVNPRPIEKMVLKYNRNPLKKANEDIAELTFLCSEDKIKLVYHVEEPNIAASTRDFTKPPNWNEKGVPLAWNPDMHSTFQVDPFAKPSKQVVLYQLLQSLIQQEEKSKERVRESEEEVREILEQREKEESMSELEISAYDTERNDKFKTLRKEMEIRILEEKLRKEEMEVDYLAPFLAQFGDPEKVTRQQAYKLKEDCLADLKQRLIDKANLIQSRFEKETQELQRRQTWYQQNQVSMSKEDEEDYLNYCSEAMFRIHILELRLNRHKEMAPHKYMAMEQRLRNDPRLAEYF